MDFNNASEDAINTVYLDLGIQEAKIDYNVSIESAIKGAESSIQDIDMRLENCFARIEELTPNCDKIDYILAASIGALCGVIDIFLVGKPGESPIGNITDKWFADRTKDFAHLCGWPKEKDELSSAIEHLEKHFKIPYDQHGLGDAGKEVYNLMPGNHHFKSLGHNPTLLGLFFSILDQFANTSHFVSGGELIILEVTDSKFELKGKDIPSKIYCGFINWFAHIISDISGSHNSKTRGAGIPSPIWCFTNDIIAIKRNLKLPVLKVDELLNDVALKIYEEGYDVRFQVAQIIPVFLNELFVRFIYSARRLFAYFMKTPKEDICFSTLWKSCEPFSNVTVRRMLTVAHGTFCSVDVLNAAVSGNPAEFFLRLNIVGIGRFIISISGEVSRSKQITKIKSEMKLIEQERNTVDEYLVNLKILSDIYDDSDLLTFVEDFKNSNMYKEAFEKTVILAEKRNVPKEKILRNKADIDAFFRGGK